MSEKTEKIGERDAQKNLTDGDCPASKKTNVISEKKSNTENVAEKVKYNPEIHSLNQKISEEKKDRFRKRDKIKKIKRKRSEKEQVYIQNYNDLLANNMPKDIHMTKSPHLVFGYKWFKKIQHNVVMLKSPTEVEVDSNRRIYYEIECFGKNVRYTQKQNSWILNVSNTLTNTIYILVRLKDIFHIPKVQYHTELGTMISKYDVDKEREYCYVLLAMINLEKKVQNSKSFIDQDDLILMKRFLRNQISMTKKSYHFNTSGTIYGFGYGPKSNRNEYGHSVCRFATSKYKNSEL